MEKNSKITDKMYIHGPVHGIKINELVGINIEYMSICCLCIAARTEMSLVALRSCCNLVIDSQLLVSDSLPPSACRVALSCTGRAQECPSEPKQVCPARAHRG